MRLREPSLPCLVVLVAVAFFSLNYMLSEGNVASAAMSTAVMTPIAVFLRRRVFRRHAIADQAAKDAQRRRTGR